MAVHSRLAWRHILKLGALGLALSVVILAGGVSNLSLYAQSETGSRPPAHLGYGVHIGPHLPAPPAVIQDLGMDWVKVYDAGQIADYPMLRVLYRMDLDWPNDWDYFRADVARRTREVIGRGVAAIEIHNEPNLSLEWPRGPNAWEYTQMLRVAYETIKSIDPNMIVVSGGLAPTLTTPDRGAINDLDFAREMLQNGAADYFDAFGYHPYGFNQPPEADPNQSELVFRRVERVRDLLVQYGAGDKPIWLTEFGWLRDPAEGDFNCAGQAGIAGFEWMVLPVETQADYTVRAFDYIDRHWPWVGPVFLWNLNWQQYDYDYEDECSHLRWYGLTEPDGTPTMTYHAVAAMPHRYSSYLPRLDANPAPLLDDETGEASAITVNEAGLPTFSIAAFCPRTIPVGAFEVVNSGWPVALTVRLEPQTFPGQGMPEVFVSTPEVRFGDDVTVYADVSDTAPGDYLLVVNLRGTYQGRTISGHARLLLQVENSPVNCQ